MIAYTLVLVLKEIVQMRSLGKIAYMSQASNMTDWMAIICVLATSILTLPVFGHSEKWTENVLLFVVLWDDLLLLW